MLMSREDVFMILFSEIYLTTYDGEINPLSTPMQTPCFSHLPPLFILEPNGLIVNLYQ